MKPSPTRASSGVAHAIKKLWRRLVRIDAKLNHWKGLFWLHVAAGVFFLLATILMIEASAYRHRASELKSGAFAGTGTVTTASTSKDRTWTVRYVYIDATGGRHEGVQNSLFGPGWRIGDRVSIQYSRRDASVSAIAPERLGAHAEANISIAWLCIVIAMIAGAFQARHYWLSYQRKLQPIAELQS